MGDPVPSLLGEGLTPPEPPENPKESPPLPPLGGGLGFGSGTGSGAGAGSTSVDVVAGVWLVPRSTGEAIARTTPATKTAQQEPIRIRSLCRFMTRHPVVDPRRDRALGRPDGLAAAGDAVASVDDRDVVSPAARDPVGAPVMREDDVVSGPGFEVVDPHPPVQAIAARAA